MAALYWKIPETIQPQKTKTYSPIASVYMPRKYKEQEDIPHPSFHIVSPIIIVVIRLGPICWHSSQCYVDIIETTHY